MPRIKSIHKIRAAAYYFVFVSRDIKRIATDFQLDTRTIRRWAEDPIWVEILDACGYTGDRAFEVQPSRNTERDAGDDFRIAREVYLKAQARGQPKHKLAAIVESETGIPRKKVGTWARKHGWRD